MINYKTNHRDALELCVDNKVIIIADFPSEIKGKEIMIFLRTQEFSEIHKKHYKASTPIRYDVYSIPPGVYFSKHLCS